MTIKHDKNPAHPSALTVRDLRKGVRVVIYHTNSPWEYGEVLGEAGTPPDGTTLSVQIRLNDGKKVWRSLEDTGVTPYHHQITGRPFWSINSLMVRMADEPLLTAKPPVYEGFELLAAYRAARAARAA